MWSDCGRGAWRPCPPVHGRVPPAPPALGGHTAARSNGHRKNGAQNLCLMRKMLYLGAKRVLRPGPRGDCQGEERRRGEGREGQRMRPPGTEHALSPEPAHAGWGQSPGSRPSSSTAPHPTPPGSCAPRDHPPPLLPPRSRAPATPQTPCRTAARVRRPAGSSLQQTSRAMERCGGAGWQREGPRSRWGEHGRKQELRCCQTPPAEPGALSYRSGRWKAGSGNGTSTSDFRYFTFEIYQTSMWNLGGS